MRTCSGIVDYGSCGTNFVYKRDSFMVVFQDTKLCVRTQHSEPMPAFEPEAGLDRGEQSARRTGRRDEIVPRACLGVHGCVGQVRRELDSWPMAHRSLLLSKRLASPEPRPGMAPVEKSS